MDRNVPNSFYNILQALPHDLHTISPSDCESLTKDVTKGEIFSTLNSLADSKSPGPNGFNVDFYKFF